jgi:hypothetical protein
MIRRQPRAVVGTVAMLLVGAAGFEPTTPSPPDSRDRHGNPPCPQGISSKRLIIWELFCG